MNPVSRGNDDPRWLSRDFFGEHKRRVAASSHGQPWPVHQWQVARQLGTREAVGRSEQGLLQMLHPDDGKMMQ